MITGYTREEVEAIPQLTRGQMLGYLDDVYGMVKEYLSKTSIEKLLTPSEGFDGKYDNYQCIQMALLDNVRHLGEIIALKARWDRKVKQ